MSSGAQNGAPGKGSLRVLIFEDCQADIALIRDALSFAGMEIHADSAVTCEKLLACARSASYDVVLSDYRMPGITGMEAFESLRSAGFDIPFILVTGALGEERAVECLKEGVADFVLKDKLFRLPSAVVRAIREHRVRREREMANGRVRQLNRLYSVLSRSGQAIVRIPEREPLLREICETLTGVGEFKTARAVLAGAEGEPLKLLASSPPEPDLEWAPAGRDLVAVAAQERRSVVSTDLHEDCRRDSRLGCGHHCACHSAGAFPLIVGGSVAGVLGITSADPRFFDEENIALLNELAADVSFALERIQAEKMRRQATEELDRFFALSQGLLAIASLEGRLLRVNRAWEAALGFSIEELLGRALQELVHPDDRPSAEAALSKTREGGDVENLELRFRSKSGDYRWLAGSATPDPERGVIFAAVRDLTERKQLEQELRESNASLREQNQRAEAATRMKSEFLANMSHELRSPLNGIIGFSEMLCDGKLGAVDARPRGFVERIHASALHLLDLINGVLDLSKVEAGRMEFQPEPVVVSELAAEVIGSLHSLAIRKCLRIEMEIEPDANRVIIDPGKLKQILHNYLSNALKFTRDGGRIVVRLKAEGANQVRLEVADDGPGIRQEDQGRLFGQFQQLDAGRAKRHQGTGLGLALTKRLVEAQGGAVGVESEAGEGSTFFAVLPREPAGCTPTSKKPPSSPISPQTASL